MSDQQNTPEGLPKTKTTKRFYAALAAVVFVALVILVFKATSSTPPANNQSRKTTPVAVVRITKAGFEPATISVKQGTKIIWTNADQGPHQVASNPYPQGTDLPSLKSGLLKNQQAYEYTAKTVGNFGYHDQLQPTINGTLVVQKSN